MDDDDLIPWNPAHFGHTDFQKETDGQLTIFFEDTNEPPDPDDFASIAAYEIAWTEWEQTQTLPQEGKQMTFNITTPFDSEIEQLKAKLAELETQKHRVSTCANRIVEQIGECVVEMKEAGVGKDSLFSWAETIFSTITGDFLPQEKLNESQDQIDSLIDQIDDLTKERNEALQKITDLTAASLRVSEELKGVRDSLAIANQESFDARKELADLELKRLDINQETSSSNLIEGYKKTIVELTIANQKITEELLKLRGELPLVELVKHMEETSAQPEESEEDPRQNAAFLEATNNQEIVSEFLRKLDRIARVDKLDWVKIKELPLNLETMRELGLQVSSKSKTHKYLLEQMPVMCAKYIEETGDSSDLDWLPGHFVESVREALVEIDSESTGEEDEEVKKSPRSTSLSEVKPVFQRGDTVRHVITNQQFTVLDVNNEWLNVQDSEGLTDMWQASNLELVAELAA
jgi:hypothetical protein